MHRLKSSRDFYFAHTDRSSAPHYQALALGPLDNPSPSPAPQTPRSVAEPPPELPAWLARSRQRVRSLPRESREKGRSPQMGTVGTPGLSDPWDGGDRGFSIPARSELRLWKGVLDLLRFHRERAANT